jgi:plastocyanin
VGDVSAGDTVEFVNDSDKEAHEMVVMRVTDDSVTLEDIQQLLAEDSEGPPAEFPRGSRFRLRHAG